MSEKCSRLRIYLHIFMVTIKQIPTDNSLTASTNVISMQYPNTILNTKMTLPQLDGPIDVVSPERSSDDRSHEFQIASQKNASIEFPKAEYARSHQSRIRTLQLADTVRKQNSNKTNTKNRANQKQEKPKQHQQAKEEHGRWSFFVPEPVAGLRYLRLTRLRRHDRGPVPGGNRSAASCPCTVLRRASYHYATRSPEEHGRWSADQFVGIMEYKKDDIIVSPKGLV